MKPNRLKQRSSVIAALLVPTVVALGFAAPARATSTPAAPVNVRITEIGWQQVTVEWDHGSSEIPRSYRIDNLTTGDVKMVSGDWTSPQLIGLEPEQTYQLEVKAVNVYTASEPVPVTATTVAMPHVDPPSDLEVVDVQWDGADLAWEPSPDEELSGYEIVDLDRDRIFKVVGSNFTTAHLDLRSEQTYRFAVRARRAQIDFQQVHSELTNEVTVTTPEQFVEPPANLQAERNGNDVTLTWERPDGLEFPDAGVEYLVFDGDTLETIVYDFREAPELEQVIPRLAAGEHQFTVRVRYKNPTRYGYGVSGPSDPASVTVPPADDVTPPTPPESATIIFDCITNEYRLEFSATDDTSPLAKLRFHILGRDSRIGSQWYVLPDFFDTPPVGPLTVSTNHRAFRTVDEAGNRSEMVQLWVPQREENC